MNDASAFAKSPLAYWSIPSFTSRPPSSGEDEGSRNPAAASARDPREGALARPLRVVLQGRLRVQGADRVPEHPAVGPVGRVQQEMHETPGLRVEDVQLGLCACSREHEQVREGDELRGGLPADDRLQPVQPGELGRG